MLSGLILGIEYEEMIERFDAIEAFADIGEFMDQPIKTYSSGMRSRLGFAVAINVEPDVLVIDEALSAGDSAFKKKAIQRMYDLRDSGSTVLFVSHSMGMVKRFCTQAILMHKGNLVSTGSPEEVVDYYEEMLAKSQEMKDAAETSELDEQLDEQLDYEIEHEEEEDTPSKGEGLGGRRSQQSRRVVGEASIVDLEVLDEEGRPTEALPSGATLSVRVHLRYEEAMEESTLGISLQSHRAGVEVFWTDTAREEAPIGRKEAGEQVKVEFTFEVPLGAGSYNVEASLTDGRPEGSDVARAREARTFEITQQGSPGPVRGLVRVPTKVEISSALEAEEQEEGPVRPA
jgi:ABC-type multidrug transport system ATPase subunit